MIDEKGVWSLVAWRQCCSGKVFAHTRFARVPKKLIARVDMLGRDWLVRTRATGSDPRMDPTCMQYNVREDSFSKGATTPGK